MTGAEKYGVGVKVGMSYKISIFCSILLLGAHLLMLLIMLQNKNATHCTSKVLTVSSEIVQVISWAITLLVLYRTHRHKDVKLPWILRVWWISIFLLNLACAILDGHSIITNHEHPRVQDYVHVLGLLASICLMGISIHGKTGVVFDISSSVSTALLNGKNEKQLEGKRDNPYGKSTILQLVTFSWLNPLFEVGIKKPLDQDEVPDIDIKDSAAFLSCSFDECLEQVRKRDGTESPCIYKAIYILTTVRRGAFIPIIILAQSSFQLLQIASNYWMAWACPAGSVEPVVRMHFILFVYTFLAVGGSLCVLIRAAFVAIAGLQTAEKLFINMLHSVIRAPMAFFDSTPTGRILNRASTDQSVLDMEMANRLGWCAFSIIQLLGTIGVMSQVAWEVFVIFIPVTAICIWYQRYYIPTARELARLAGIQRAPILHHFAESLSGAATIRAFDQKGRFIDSNLHLIDNHSRPWFHNVAAMEWLSFRLNQLSNFVFAFSLLLLVTLPEGIIDPSIAGLAVTYGINLNVLQASVIWNICNAENKMISVERILQYSNIASEAPIVIEDCQPPENWPDTGTIQFTNLKIRYAEHLPSVLKNITCTFPGKKKVGVVGRTGSGKSTLIQAIFRIVEPRDGSIAIDGVDITKMGLHDLRSRLSIIPQDPTMFEGTVRGNLDPLEQYVDNEIWEALDKCQLGDIVRAKQEKLEAAVVENGENWSVGQRQLFCLGRALLKKSKVLVLDEATASVDSATDGMIQKIINQEFKDRTIVTIAHRIHTVIDSDLVLVLSDGRIAEYDTPAKLLEREDSFFSRLIKEYSKRSQSFSNLSKFQS